MPVQVKAALRAAAIAAAFGTAGAMAYESQLLLPRLIPYGTQSAAAFDGAIIAHRLARTTLLSDDGRWIAIGAGTQPAVIAQLPPASSVADLRAALTIRP